CLLRSSIVRTSKDDGVFTFRNLPTGDHRLLAEQDVTGDGVPDVMATVAFRIVDRQGTRGWVDVGTVNLAAAATVVGQVVVPSGRSMIGVQVGLADVGVALIPGEEGRFELTGLPAGD